MEAPSMQQQNAIALLSPGCIELGLPKALATELWHFLNVRARHSDAGPSSTIDELWHWMLLNTDVAAEAHSLLGCVVRHSTASAADLLRAKLLRRLRSLNLLLAAGHALREELWRDPNVKLTKLPVRSELTREPTGSYVYVAIEAPRRTPHQDIVRFVTQNFCAPGQSLGRGGEHAEAQAGALGKRSAPAPEGQVEHEPLKRFRFDASLMRKTYTQSSWPGRTDDFAAPSSQPAQMLLALQTNPAIVQNPAVQQELQMFQAQEQEQQWLYAEMQGQRLWFQQLKQQLQQEEQQMQPQMQPQTQQQQQQHMQPQMQHQQMQQPMQPQMQPMQHQMQQQVQQQQMQPQMMHPHMVEQQRQQMGQRQQQQQCQQQQQQQQRLFELQQAAQIVAQEEESEEYEGDDDSDAGVVSEEEEEEARQQFLMRVLLLLQQTVAPEEDSKEYAGDEGSVGDEESEEDEEAVRQQIMVGMLLQQEFQMRMHQQQAQQQQQQQQQQVHPLPVLSHQPLGGRIAVTMLAGKTITLETESSDTILDIKAKIQRIEGTPLDQMILIVAGMRPEDGRTIADCSIRQGSTLYLKLK
ncbi:hypothetical protein FOA52_001991 [Chlamydomonas sp. UWO 241]|nr:hypothetical protein FOA52_001991 [Chlamydomonas sp. UWO 241]